jgi:hypothetical protein
MAFVRNNSSTQPVVSLGSLSDDEFQAAVERARTAGRAAIGMPAAPPQPVAPARPAAAPASAPPKVAARPAEPRARRVGVSLPVIGGCLLGLAALGGGAYLYASGRASAPPAAAAAPAAASTGTLKIVSRPIGAKVSVDGVARGAAPLTLSLPVGEHTLQLDNGSAVRSLPVTIDQGAMVAQYIDLAAAATQMGQLEVTSDPAGARVSIDGKDRGVSPLLASDLTPGSHQVTITNGEATVTRTVTVTAGSTASVLASLAPAAGSAGWVAIKSPLPLQILEGESVLATAGVDRLMLPVGRHQLQVAAPEFAFRAPLAVNIQAGKTTTVNVPLPNGTLAINAVPWADVWLDGAALGTTPLGRVSVTIGTHEIVWKHPQFGERRQTIKVTADGITRAGVSFTK